MPITDPQEDLGEYHPMERLRIWMQRLNSNPDNNYRSSDCFNEEAWRLWKQWLNTDPITTENLEKAGFTQTGQHWTDSTGECCIIFKQDYCQIMTGSNTLKVKCEYIGQLIFLVTALTDIETFLSR